MRIAILSIDIVLQVLKIFNVKNVNGKFENSLSLVEQLSAFFVKHVIFTKHS